MKISKRLKFIESICDKCDTFLDVGTDHGYVPYLILQNNKANKIIATDIRIKPLESCKNNLSKFSNKNVVYRIGDGLQVIDYNEANGICICGIGYDLLKKILENIENYTFDYMILSPHTKQNDFVKFLKSKKLFFNTYKISDNGKDYYIYKVRRNFLLFLKDKFLR